MNIFEVKELIDFQFSWVHDGLFPSDYVVLTNYITKHAQPWLDAHKQTRRMLYRGVRSSPINVYAFRQPVRRDRRPKDSTELAHKAMDAMIASVGGVANRSNAVFCSFDKGLTFEYGETMAAIPIGQFNYTWSPIMGDWYDEEASNRRFSYFLKDEISPVNDAMEKRYQERVRVLKDRVTRAEGDVDLYVAKLALDHFLSPKGKQAYYQEWVYRETNLVPEETWDKILTNPHSYDPKKVRDFIRTDEGIDEVSNTTHEVMIHCNQMLYVHPVIMDTIHQIIDGRISVGGIEFLEQYRHTRSILTGHYSHEMGGALREGKIRNAALAGIATAGLAGAMTSPAKQIRNIDALDIPTNMSHELERRLPPLPIPYDEPEEEKIKPIELEPEVDEEVQLRFLASAIARKYRINPELSFKIVDLAHKYEDEVFPKAIDILAVIAVESSFNPRAVSKLRRDPARGLMQVRPGIWGIEPSALNNIENQIKAGVRVLQKYHRRAGDAEGALHAYNIGITNYRRGKRNPAYVAKVERERDFLYSVLN